MSIGTTIKKLRHAHDMTQEQLASLLNLTPAAISGWECDRNAPDVSQIPLLCRIFGVSADVLLGIDLSAQEERIEKIIDEAEKLRGRERVERYRLALAEFPASYRLMSLLANCLCYDGEDDTASARVKEKITLLERILEASKEEHLKNKAAWQLCVLYLNQGRRDEAVKIAESIPYLMYTQKDFEWLLAEEMEKIYHLHYGIQEEFASLCSKICNMSALAVDGKPFFTSEQAITMLEKIPKLYEAFYENKDYLGQACMLSLVYTRMAEQYAKLKDAPNTLACIKSALQYAKETDAYYEGLETGCYSISDVWEYPQLPKEKRHTSILANPDYDYPTTTISMDVDEENHQLKQLMSDLDHPEFDFIREEIQKLF